MGVVPIFIPVRQRSDRELQAEMESERRMREAIRKDEEIRERRRREEEERKRVAEEERRKRLDQEYLDARAKNPWDYQFLPEGWSIFGQRSIRVITEFYDGVAF